MQLTRRYLALGVMGLATAWLPSAWCQPQAAAEAPRAVDAPMARGVVIDGALDEDAWRDGPWYSGFTATGSGAAATVATRFAVRHGEACLYLAAVMDEPLIADLKHAATGRDGRDLWRDDCVEFMVDPTGDRVEYVHLAINANGALYDAQVRQGGHVATREWNSTAAVAGRIGTASWSVEVALPFADLGLEARSARQPWAIQVARERHATGKLELSAYVPSGGSFHVPSTYAPLRLLKADLTRFLWEVKAPLQDLVVDTQDGLLYQFDVTVVNGTGRRRDAVLTAVLESFAGEQRTTTAALMAAAEGPPQTVALAVPVPAAGRGLLTLQLAERERPEAILARRQVPVALEHTPVRLTVLQPCYRDTIYATEALDEVVVRAELQLPAERRRGAVVTARLQSGGGADGAVIARAQARTDDSAVELRLAVGDLPIGRHRLVVEAALADGRRLEAATAITRAPRVEHEWRLDEDLVLRHNGEAVLPYGWFSAPATEAPALATEGVTVILDYNAQWFPPERTLAWLDDMQRHGLYGTFYPWPSAAFMKTLSGPVSPEDEAALRARVRAFRQHPALMAYYLWDEPELRPLEPERAEALYRIIADEDPYHPCIMLNDSLPGIQAYRHGGDILMPDPYPLFVRGGLAGRPIEHTSRFMRACREASAGRKAWWITPQAFDYYMNKENSRAPTLVELRNQQLQAIINGARGFIWYTYSHRHNVVDLDLGMPFIGREAERLRQAILAPEMPGAVTWEAEADEHLQAAVRQVGDDLVIFAVNTRTSPQKATLTLAGDAPTTLYVVSEDRAVTLDQGRFSDRFDLYEGHIYTTRRDLAAGPTLAQAQAAIARELAARRKPGNLALRDLGTTVTASSTHTYAGALWMTTDGAVRGNGWRDMTPKQYPDWLQVALPKTATVGRVELYSDTITDADVQVLQNGQWRTVGHLTPAPEGPLVARFTPLPAEAVRVVISQGREDLSTITEIEIYAE